MKKNIWLLVILLSINLIFFPKRCNVASIDTTNGKVLNKTSVLFLSPIWSSSYDGHLVLLSPLPQLNNPNVVISSYAVTDFEGNTKEPESKLALNIWSIYFLIPTILIFLLSLFFPLKKKAKNT
jgi:hypothetical protein